MISSPVSGQRGQFDLPELDPVAVGTAGIGGDQELGGVGEPRLSHGVPPAPDGFDREGRRVGRVADRDPALVMSQVVDPVRDGPAQFLVDEVMGLGAGRLACGVEFASAVGELAHQLFLLGVHGDHRLVLLHEPADLFVEVDELEVSIGMGGTLLLLGGSLERVAERLEDPPDRVIGDLVALAHQLGGQLARRLRRPAHVRHRIAPSLGMDQLIEGFCQSGLLVLGLDVTTTGRPLPIRGLDPFAHFAFCLDHRVAAHARALGHRCLATASERLGHGAGHHPALEFVQMRLNHLEESRELISTGLHQTILHRAS